MAHIVTIPDDRRGTGRAADGTSTAFLNDVLGPHSVQRISRSKLTRITDIGSHNLGELAPAAFGAQPNTASLLIQGVHQAYAAHLGFGLRPEVFWYAVVSEISEHVRQHSDRYRKVLGMGWKQGVHNIRTHSWDHSSLYERFYTQLSDTLGERLSELFVPQLSTMDIEDRMALVAAFMEAVGPYRDYQVSAQCKLPHIEVEGTPADWQLLRQNVGELSELFPDLEGYLYVVSSILHSIYCDVAGLEINLGDFWEQLYEWKDDPNGPFARGWITSLFAHTRMPTGNPVLRDDLAWWDPSWSGMRVGQFASHITSVPISSEGASYSRTLIAGILGIKLSTADGLQVLTPRLGWGVVNIG